MTYDLGQVDVVVIGAGHAGCEAALAVSRMGLTCLCLTLHLDAVALMACNPSIGGSAKGHLVREIDALGGGMGLSADQTLLQMKTLGTGKGPAVQSYRAQADKPFYQHNMRRRLEEAQGVQLRQGEAAEILTREGRVCGVRLTSGGVVSCRAAIVASGVYLQSRVLVGDMAVQSGPSGLFPATYLSQNLTDLGFTLQRFKTGTPPRVDGRSLNYAAFTLQWGDENPQPFSYLTPALNRPHLPCYLAHTNENTHAIIRENIHRSPLYCGVIEGVGPRYCPSIEDKVMRFADKTAHPVFIEPESQDGIEMYVQGLSTSLPEDVQLKVLRSIDGCQNARIMRPGYAIEYDCIDARALTHALMARHVPGLFFAGQVNGTSGYEEAGAQGVLAGLNAGLFVRDLPPLILTRENAYLGVLVDDLVLRGTPEPYRMMTARAEHRLLLFQDSADLRLTELARQAGAVDDARYAVYTQRKTDIENATKQLQTLKISPEEAAKILSPAPSIPILASDLLKRGDVDVFKARAVLQLLPEIPQDCYELAANFLRYDGYIRRQAQAVEKAKRWQDLAISADFDYHAIKALRTEARMKLSKICPPTLGAAGRISGVSPADVQVLLVVLTRLQRQHGNPQGVNQL